MSRDMASVSRSLGRSRMMGIRQLWLLYIPMKNKIFIRIDILMCTHIPCVIISIAVYSVGKY
jgi:hypothetical protein